MSESGIPPANGVVHYPSGCTSKSILRDLHVLVVDDMADNCEVVGLVLGLYGARVTTAQSAAAALRALEAEWFDVIVSDIAMPEVDGFEFLRRIREYEVERERHVPVIALTATENAHDPARTAGAEFQACLPKPIGAEKLVGVVAAVAGRC